MNASTSSFEFLEPWESLEEEARSGAENELARELGPDHVLAGVTCRALGHRCDCDDFLFEVTGTDRGKLALVHLTWSGKPDAYPEYPSTEFFESWEAFRDREMIPVHEDYTS